MISEKIDRQALYEEAYNRAKKIWVDRGLAQVLGNDDVESYADGYAHGYVEEYVKGYEIGKKKAMREVIAKLFQEGYDADFICAITGMSKEELTKLI